MVVKKKGEGVGPADCKRNTNPVNRASGKKSLGMVRFDRFFARSELLDIPPYQMSTEEMDKIWGKLDEKFKGIFE